MGKLDGKIAWVTGAGSGIGEAAALALAEEGATVILTGRRREPLEDVARRIGDRAHVQPADLTVSAQVQKVGDYIRKTFNRLDILINNAGVNILERHWANLTPEGIDTLVHGNLSSALYCITVALPFMRAQQDDAGEDRIDPQRGIGDVGGVAAEDDEGGMSDVDDV
ncbi:MAG: SDR family NAD(P)-dependent oxidoreductase, partial [Rhodospirillales bacterium]|nr:SDR family NAD(P)-dependent oxidoreductase [Rhodospirillales bacterium]